MRVARLPFSLVLSALTLIPSAAQQTASSSAQGSQLLQQSLAALQSNTSLTDVTLSGTLRRIAGSDDESGTTTLKAIAGDAGRMDLMLPSGQRSEVQNLTATQPAGAWSGPDGAFHPIAFHNLLAEPVCFFPAFAIAATELVGGVEAGVPAAETALKAASMQQAARAATYAASRPNSLGGIGLVCPSCSSVFRGMISKAEFLGEASEALPLLEVSYAAVTSGIEAGKQARSGECAAAFPIF